MGGTSPAHTWISGVQPPGLGEDKWLWVKPPCVWCFAGAAPGTQDRLSEGPELPSHPLLPDRRVREDVLDALGPQTGMSQRGCHHRTDTTRRLLVRRKRGIRRPRVLSLHCDALTHVQNYWPAGHDLIQSKKKGRSRLGSRMF